MLTARRWNLLIPLLALGTGAAQAQTAAVGAAPYRLLHTIPLKGDGKWDFLSVDPAGQRLYVSHATQVEVVDLQTRQQIGTIPNTPGVHGIEVIPGAGRGYVTCGRVNQCVVFDTKTLQPIGAPIATGPKPDALFYDAFSGRVFLFSNKGGQSTVLDARTGAVVGTAALGGDVEAPATDGKGGIFVNIEDKNEVIEFDAKSLAVRHRYSVAPGDGPTGLAYDPKAGRLFSACANEKLVITDSRTGQQVAVLPIGKKADGAAFDPATGNVIVSCGEGLLTVIHQDSPSKYRVVATVRTAPGAATLAFDPVSHHIFVCTADYGPAPAPTEAEPKPKPGIVAGTFRVLEYGQ